MPIGKVSGINAGTILEAAMLVIPRRIVLHRIEDSIIITGVVYCFFGGINGEEFL